MEVIQHIELASAQSSITFSSIPQTFTDLYLVTSFRTSATDPTAVYFEFNGVTTGYSARRLIGSGSSASSQSFTQGFFTGAPGSAATANTFDSSACLIPNYTGSNAKSFSSDHVTENNSTVAYQVIYAGLWSGTSAISEIVIKPFAGNLVQYSSATLFGITAGSDGVTTVS